MRAHVSITQINDDHFVQRIADVPMRAEAGAFAWVTLRLLFKESEVGRGECDDLALRVENFVGNFLKFQHGDQLGAFCMLIRMRPASPERNTRTASLISSNANSCVKRPSSFI